MSALIKKIIGEAEGGLEDVERELQHLHQSFIEDCMDPNSPHNEFAGILRGPMTAEEAEKKWLKMAASFGHALRYDPDTRAHFDWKGRMDEPPAANG